MSLVSTLHSSITNSLRPTTGVEEYDSEAVLSSLLGAFTNRSPRSSMERGAPEYSQSDHASAIQSNNNFSSATPTSEYGVHPTSARSSTFPEHIQRQQYYPSSNHSGSSGDPSIAASSPTYPPHGGQYSPYPPQQEMSHGYPQHPGGPMYAQPRPDWAGYGQQPHHGMPAPYQTTGVSTPTSAAPAGARPGQHPLSQVYSFVPIPGAQQHKRPRRRYEEIERMYKCGWNGCEKAYGTLNHLNAHVTMQSHGQKRTPEGMFNSYIVISESTALVPILVLSCISCISFVSRDKIYIVVFLVEIL
jgi:hypothetical protein